MNAPVQNPAANLRLPRRLRGDADRAGEGRRAHRRGLQRHRRLEQPRRLPEAVPRPPDQRRHRRAEHGRRRRRARQRRASSPSSAAPAPFLTGRALEQIKVDVAYNGFPVVLCGMSPGMAYGELGPTHHSIEDLSWLRAIDGLGIVVPADPAQTSAAVRWAATSGTPVLPARRPHQGSGRDARWRGRLRASAARTCLRKGGDCRSSRPGAMVSRALAAADALAERGVKARVLNISTVKPLDEAAIVAAARETGAIVTVEEAVDRGRPRRRGRRDGRAPRAGPDAHPRRHGLRPDRDRRVPVRSFRPQPRRHRRRRARTEEAREDVRRPHPRDRPGHELDQSARGRRTRRRGRSRPGAGVARDAGAGLGASRTPTRSGRACSAPRAKRSIPTTAKRVVSVGLSTQRESCVIWDRRTGEALTPVLSWQDQRTEAICAALRGAGHGATIRRTQRPAARSDVLRRQGALAARPPAAGSGARESRRDLHRHDRRLSSVALRRRGGGRGRQRLAHAALRCRRREVGRGAACDFRCTPRRPAPRRRFRRGRFRTRAGLRRCPTAFRSARCWPIRIPPCSRMAPLRRGRSRRRRARAPPSWASSTGPPSATATPARRAFA